VRYASSPYIKQTLLSLKGENKAEYIKIVQKGNARQGCGDKEKVVMNYCSLQRTIRFKTIEELLGEIVGE